MRGCIVTLPHGAGKSSFLSMYWAWVDIGVDRNARKNLWADTAIRAAVTREKRARQKYRIEREGFWLAGECYCLVFDLANIKIADKGIALIPINAYLMTVIRAFVTKYEDLGMGSFEATALAGADPAIMIIEILTRVAERKLKLFIGVDHWDAPILSSFAHKNYHRSKTIANDIASFLATLTSGPGQSEKRVNLLILGNLPLFGLGKDGPHRVIEDISWHKDLEGAKFGVSEDELENFFSVLGHNRNVMMPDPDISGDLKSWKYGAIVQPHPPPPPAPHAPVLGAAAQTSGAPASEPTPPLMLSISGVLHRTAIRLNLSSDHTTLVDSPWLTDLSQRCEAMLRYSSLRRKRWLRIPYKDLIRTFTLESLLAHMRDDKALHALLVYLGAVKMDVWEGVIFLKISHVSAMTQLFRGFPAIPASESIRDAQLIGLLESDPRFIIRAVGTLLGWKPWADLY
ncbi:hypothetical protein C8R47DRAFT_1123981 [Mycena vitilis]|nr:hypothetical protein C8R47DRAFT_1123981 [Mycena vitilis]